MIGKNGPELFNKEARTDINEAFIKAMREFSRFEREYRFPRARAKRLLQACWKFLSAHLKRHLARFRGFL